MKNIQIIDGAINSVFEVYEVDDTIFYEIFGDDKDVVFWSNLTKYLDDSDDPREEVWKFWQKVYSCRKDKKIIHGIHGTLHLDGSNGDKECFPGGKESLVINTMSLQK